MRKKKIDCPYNKKSRIKIEVYYRMKKILLFFLCLIIFGNNLFADNTGREIRPINNNWEFLKTDFEKDFKAGSQKWELVNIPHTWNNKDAQSGEGFYSGTGWYRKEVSLEKSLENKRIFIRFQGVGQVAEVFVNGKFIGKHKGSYAAFCFEITHVAQFGNKNTFFIKVNNESLPDIIPVNNFFFTIFGGIYRPVSLIITDKLNITPTDYASPGVYIRQKIVDTQLAELTITTKLENRYKKIKRTEIRTTVFIKNGRIAEQISKHVGVNPTGVVTVNQELTINNPHLWHGRENPYLYKAAIDMLIDGKIIDQVIQPFGFRFYHIDNQNGFFLNGKPYRLYGVCRHQEWKDLGNALNNEQEHCFFVE